MFTAVLLLGITASGAVTQGPETEATEVVEVNHCYNRDTGERRFIQVIYWDRYDASTLHVREWHMLEQCHSIHHVHRRTDMPFTVIRRRDGKMQIVRARHYRVTHTFSDPEEEDRRFLPVDARRPLGQ